MELRATVAEDDCCHGKGHGNIATQKTEIKEIAKLYITQQVYDVDTMNIPHLKEMKAQKQYLIHSVSRQKYS